MRLREVFAAASRRLRRPKGPGILPMDYADEARLAKLRAENPFGRLYPDRGTRK